jgi:hypothetical protein
VHVTALQAKPGGSADRTGCEEPHRAEVVEAIEDTPHAIIGKSLRGDGLAQEQCGVLLRKELSQAVQRAAAPQRIQHKPQHDRARVHLHLCRDVVVDKANEAQLVSVGLDNRQMVDGIDLDSGRYVRHGSLPQGVLLAATSWLQRRFPQGENDQHFWVFQRSSRVLEDHRKMSQPGNRLARLVERGFPQDRVVAALVDVHDDPFRLDFDHTPCFHEFAVQLFGRSGVEAAQLLGQPALATIGQHGHGGVEIDVESHFTRQTIDVKEIHANPQPVLDAIASGVAYDQCPRTLLGVGG